MFHKRFGIFLFVVAVISAPFGCPSITPSPEPTPSIITEKYFDFAETTMTTRLRVYQIDCPSLDTYIPVEFPADDDQLDIHFANGATFTFAPLDFGVFFATAGTNSEGEFEVGMLTLTEGNAVEISFLEGVFHFVFCDGRFLFSNGPAPQERGPEGGQQG
jgi:hypothetical protein